MKHFQLVFHWWDLGCMFGAFFAMQTTKRQIRVIAYKFQGLITRIEAETNKPHPRPADVLHVSRSRLGSRCVSPCLWFHAHDLIVTISCCCVTTDRTTVICTPCKRIQYSAISDPIMPLWRLRCLVWVIAHAPTRRLLPHDKHSLAQWDHRGICSTTCPRQYVHWPILDDPALSFGIASPRDSTQ